MMGDATRSTDQTPESVAAQKAAIERLRDRAAIVEGLFADAEDGDTVDTAVRLLRQCGMPHAATEIESLSHLWVEDLAARDLLRSIVREVERTKPAQDSPLRGLCDSYHRAFEE